MTQALHRGDQLLLQPTKLDLQNLLGKHIQHLEQDIGRVQLIVELDPNLRSCLLYTSPSPRDS